MHNNPNHCDKSSEVLMCLAQSVKVFRIVLIFAVENYKNTWKITRNGRRNYLMGASSKMAIQAFNLNAGKGIEPKRCRTRSFQVNKFEPLVTVCDKINSIESDEHTFHKSCVFYLGTCFKPGHILVSIWFHVLIKFSGCYMVVLGSTRCVLSSAPVDWCKDMYGIYLLCVLLFLDTSDMNVINFTFIQ